MSRTFLGNIAFSVLQDINCVLTGAISEYYMLLHFLFRLIEKYSVFKSLNIIQ